MILAHGLNRIIELRYLTNTIRFQSKILNKPLAYSDACYIALPMSWRLCLLAVLQPQWTFTTSSYCPCWANPKGRPDNFMLTGLFFYINHTTMGCWLRYIALKDLTLLRCSQSFKGFLFNLTDSLLG